MKRIILLLTLLTVVLALVVGCEKKPPEGQVFGEAKALQEQGKFAEAVAAYEKFVQMYPKSKSAPQAQFMVGFIYANELKDVAKAEAAYKTFLNKFESMADSGMVASAQWELKYLGKDINEIEELSTIMHQDSLTETSGADSAAIQVQVH
ncbi:MAG: outer membrane protein assembly factor BamD [Candidatus Zixiibacteriota bacterium]|nr:MAG: outer membrane protein assembly factor BamD [candidate division Zixibacteria bacterium]